MGKKTVGQSRNVSKMLTKTVTLCPPEQNSIGNTSLGTKHPHDM